MEKHSLVAAVVLGAFFVVAGSCAVTTSPEVRLQSSGPPGARGPANVERFQIVIEEEPVFATVARNESALIGAMPDVRHRWEPDIISAVKQDTVILTIENRQDTSHVFALPDYNVQALIRPKDKVTVQFAADKAGTFPWFCVSHGDAAQSNSGRSDPVQTGSLYVVGR